MDVILAIIVFVIIIRIVPMIIGGAIGIVLGLLRVFFENLDLIIPAVPLYLPLKTTGDYRWWEYCMVDHEADYDNPWRIRPLYREDACTGKYDRTWGGVGLWTFAILENLN